MTAPDAVLPASRQPMPGPPAPPRARSPVEIEQELQETTDRLASRVDELARRVRPRQVARRTVASVRDRLTTPRGRPRPEIVGAAIGGLVGLAVLVWRAGRRG